MLALPWNSVALSAIHFPVLDLPGHLLFLGKKKIPKGECLWRSKKIAGKPRFANARTSQAAVTCPMVGSPTLFPTVFILTVVSCRKSWDVPVSLCMDDFVALTLSVSVKWGRSQPLCLFPAHPSACVISSLSYQRHELTANDRFLPWVIDFDPNSLHFPLMLLSFCSWY